MTDFFPEGIDLDKYKNEINFIDHDLFNGIDYLLLRKDIETQLWNSRKSDNIIIDLIYKCLILSIITNTSYYYNNMPNLEIYDSNYDFSDFFNIFKIEKLIEKLQNRYIQSQNVSFEIIIDHFKQILKNNLLRYHLLLIYLTDLFDYELKFQRNYDIIINSPNDHWRLIKYSVNERLEYDSGLITKVQLIELLNQLTDDILIKDSRYYQIRSESTGEILPISLVLNYKFISSRYTETEPFIKKIIKIMVPERPSGLVDDDYGLEIYQVKQRFEFETPKKRNTVKVREFGRKPSDKRREKQKGQRSDKANARRFGDIINQNQSEIYQVKQRFEFETPKKRNTVKVREFGRKPSDKRREKQKGQRSDKANARRFGDIINQNQSVIPQVSGIQSLNPGGISFENSMNPYSVGAGGGKKNYKKTKKKRKTKRLKRRKSKKSKKSKKKSKMKRK